jgi:hypothetical protein
MRGLRASRAKGRGCARANGAAAGAAERVAQRAARERDGEVVVRGEMRRHVAEGIRAHAEEQRRRLGARWSLAAAHVVGGVDLKVRVARDPVAADLQGGQSRACLALAMRPLLVVACVVACE